MDERGASLVHQLELFLRVEILRDQAHDTNQLPLPILKSRGSLLDQVQQVLLRQAELALDLLETPLRRVGILRALSGAGHGAPQIIVGCFRMRPPLFGPALLLGKVGFGPMGVAVDPMVLKRMRRIENALYGLDPVPFLASCDIVASKT